MLTFITVIHVLLCMFMIFVILLQPGKDAGMGAAFGGGAATSAFGGRGAVTFLSKLTAACAVMFFLTSLGLSFVGLRQSVAATEPVLPSAPAAGSALGADAGVTVPPGLEKAPTDQAIPSDEAEKPKEPPAPTRAPPPLKGKPKK